MNKFIHFNNKKIIKFILNYNIEMNKFIHFNIIIMNKFIIKL